MDIKKFATFLIYSWLTYGLSSEPLPPKLQCLTGYMTDVQSWVNSNGRLTDMANKTSSIDVSYQPNCIRELQLQLQKHPCNSSVIYVTLAKCHLRQVPMAFRFTVDQCGRLLSNVLQYLSMYGNKFGEEGPIALKYRVEMNATSAATINREPVRWGSAKIIWSSGLQGMMFPRLRELDLRLCGIQELEDNVFSGMPNLEKLFLGENNIFLISDMTFSGLNNLVHLDISRNYEYDKNGTYRGLYFYNWRVFQKMPALRYFYITMRNSMMLSLINKDEVIDENAIFNYDVFVSYCNEDRAWVLDHLLPNVEADCTVGLSILENIVSCMDRSKAIMLIISRKFLLSQWCQFEMHLAQHRLLETRREDLIIVLLEDIPRRLRPNTLHYLMVTNTYIAWPKECAEQKLFWRRLKKSLVTHKMKQADNVSLA
ncbi:unnamed protein product, partial [Iphiclides podalirius]